MTKFEQRVKRTGGTTPLDILRNLSAETGERGPSFWPEDAGLIRARLLLLASSAASLRNYACEAAALECDAQRAFLSACLPLLGGSQAADLADRRRVAEGLDPVAPHLQAELDKVRKDEAAAEAKDEAEQSDRKARRVAKRKKDAEAVAV